MIGKSRIIIILALVLCQVVLLSALVYAQPSDIQGHWAVKQINNFLDQGMAQGYNDGTFKPDNNISRAEFIALTNHAFNFTTVVPIEFSDVSATDWFAADVAKARSAGYISGYQDNNFRPNEKITRQEVAAILARAAQLDTAATGEGLKVFADAGDIPGWSQGAVGAVVARGFMHGYPDQTFKAGKCITRAEAIVTLSNATADIFIVDIDSQATLTLLSSEVTDKGDISLTFDKNLESTDKLAGKQGQFTVMVDGKPDVVTDISLTNTPAKIKLTLTSQVNSGQVVTVAYNKHDDISKQVKAADGSVLESFAAKKVTNNR